MLGLNKPFSVYSVPTSASVKNNKNTLFVAVLVLSFSIFASIKNLRDLFEKP